MALKTIVEDGSGNGSQAKVTKRGQLVTSPLEFSDPVFHTLSQDDTPDTWFKPEAGKRVVITSLIVQTNRNVVTSGVTVQIYEASEENSATIAKALFEFDMSRQQTIVISPLNIIITEGKYVNAVADDSNVLITINGYYVDA